MIELYETETLGTGDKFIGRYMTGKELENALMHYIGRKVEIKLIPRSPESSQRIIALFLL